MSFQLPCEPARFALDASDQVFDGYDCRQNWNGWAVPYFTKEQADIVCARTNEIGQYQMFYDPERDAYVMPWGGADKPEDYEVFDATTIKDAEGHQIKVYSIGGFAWCWESGDNQQSTEQLTPEKD